MVADEPVSCNSACSFLYSDIKLCVAFSFTTVMFLMYSLFIDESKRGPAELSQTHQSEHPSMSKPTHRTGYHCSCVSVWPMYPFPSSTFEKRNLKGLRPNHSSPLYSGCHRVSDAWSGNISSTTCNKSTIKYFMVWTEVIAAVQI